MKLASVEVEYSVMSRGEALSRASACDKKDGDVSMSSSPSGILRRRSWIEVLLLAELDIIVTRKSDMGLYEAIIKHASELSRHGKDILAEHIRVQMAWIRQQLSINVPASQASMHE